MPLFVALVVRMGVLARGRPVVSGRETLLDGAGEVLADFDRRRLGERPRRDLARAQRASRWSAGQRVRVTGIDGLALDVEPQSTEAKGDVS